MYNYYIYLEPCALNAEFQHFIPRLNTNTHKLVTVGWKYEHEILHGRYYCQFHLGFGAPAAAVIMSALHISHLPSSMAIKLPQTSNLCIGGNESRCEFFSLGNAFKKRIDSVTLTSHGCKDEQRIFAWVLLLPVLRGFEAL